MMLGESPMPYAPTSQCSTFVLNFLHVPFKHVYFVIGIFSSPRFKFLLNLQARLILSILLCSLSSSIANLFTFHVNLVNLQHPPSIITKVSYLISMWVRMFHILLKNYYKYYEKQHGTKQNNNKQSTFYNSFFGPFLN